LWSFREYALDSLARAHCVQVTGKPEVSFSIADKPEHGVRKQCGVTRGRYGHFPQPDFWALS
jgi:hypothetical protein